MTGPSHSLSAVLQLCFLSPSPCHVHTMATLQVGVDGIWLETPPGSNWWIHLGFSCKSQQKHREEPGEAYCFVCLQTGQRYSFSYYQNLSSSALMNSKYRFERGIPLAFGTEWSIHSSKTFANNNESNRCSIRDSSELKPNKFSIVFNKKPDPWWYQLPESNQDWGTLHNP